VGFVAAGKPVGGPHEKNANANTSVVRKVPSWEPSWANVVILNVWWFLPERVVASGKQVAMVDQGAERRLSVGETGDLMVEVSNAAPQGL